MIDGSRAMQGCNVMAMVDVSGSMSGTPMEAAVALGTIVAYAQNRESPYFRKVMTFDSTPVLYRLAPIYESDVGILGDDDRDKLLPLGQVRAPILLIFDYFP
jgi:hypothetical protein